jgi:hypothetical protein
VFPIAHAWLVERLVAKPSPAHHLGCVWPDMLFESPLTHAQSHRGGAGLVAHLRTLDGETAGVLRQFVAGVLTHGSEPRGFDWYSDEEYGGADSSARGYAFQKGQVLAHDAARACDVPEDAGWWKAHNLVEMAFERPLYAERHEWGDRLLAACGDEALIDSIAAELSTIFALPADALALPMRRFPEVSQLRPSSALALAERYAVQTRLKHPGAVPDVAAIAGLIERAEEIIAPDGQRFLADCEEAVGAMLRETLGAA